jgi:hypothetical protein
VRTPIERPLCDCHNWPYKAQIEAELVRRRDRAAGPNPSASTAFALSTATPNDAGVLPARGPAVVFASEGGA